MADRLGSLSLSQQEQRPVRGRWFGRLLLLCVIAIVGIFWADNQQLINARQLLAIGISDVGEVPTIRGVAISRASSEVLLSLSGVIHPGSRIDVTPLIPGPIVALPVAEGEYVKKGDLLAKILDTNYLADLHQAEASLALATSQLLELQAGTRPEEIDRARALLASGEADLVNSQKTFERMKMLYERGAINEAEFDVAEAKLKTAKAEVARLNADLKLAVNGPRQEVIDAAAAEVSRAEAAIEKAQFFVDHAEVISPADGIVLERKAELGEVSRSDYFLTSLCVIGDMSTAEVSVDVQERQLRKVEAGQRCRVIPDAYPQSVYQGTVKRIQPQVNRQRGVVRVLVKLDDPDEKLLSDMNARVEFLDTAVLEAKEDLLPIPNEALFEGDDGPFVYQWKEGVVSTMRVEIVGSTTSEESTLVWSGLNEQDVLLLPQQDQRLSDGSAVNVDITNVVDVK